MEDLPKRPRGRPAKNLHRARLGNGLLPQQVYFLDALGRAGSLDGARHLTGFSRDRLWRWLNKDEAFRAAFDECMDGIVETAKKVIQAGAFEATNTLVDAQKARKPLKVEVYCPTCGKMIKTTIQIDDWAVRKSAAEALLKGSRILIDRKQIDIDVTQLTWAERLSLIALKSDPNARIPPATLERLRIAGLLPGGQGDIIEGEVREIIEEEEVL